MSEDDEPNVDDLAPSREAVTAVETPSLVLPIFQGAVITEMPTATCSRMRVEIPVDPTDARLTELKARVPYALFFDKEKA